MNAAFGSCTSPTLLGRLREVPTDQAAWQAFVERYGPKIRGWCRRHGLQDADAHEVTQDVLAKLAEKMRTFAYDPSRSFRSWLRTLTRHALADFLAGRERPGQGSGDSRVLEQLHAVEARDDLVKRLGEEFDLELLQEAMCRVRLRVEPAKWEVFRRMALEGLSGADVAQQLSMKVATVFVVRSKVQKMLREEIRKLEAPGKAEHEE